jgi:hypothetical protein
MFRWFCLLCGLVLFINHPVSAGTFIDRSLLAQCRQVAKQQDHLHKVVGLQLPNGGPSCWLQQAGAQPRLWLSRLDGAVLFELPPPPALRSPGCEEQGTGFYDHNADAQAEIILLIQCKAAGGNIYYQHAFYWSHPAGWQFDADLSQAISRFTDYPTVHRYLQNHAIPPAPPIAPTSPAAPSPQVIMIDGHFQRYADGIAFIRMDKPEWIYPVRSAPNNLRLNSAPLPSKPVRAQVRLLDTWQQGVAQYQAIAVEAIQALPIGLR